MVSHDSVLQIWRKFAEEREKEWKKFLDPNEEENPQLIGLRARANRARRNSTGHSQQNGALHRVSSSSTATAQDPATYKSTRSSISTSKASSGRGSDGMRGAEVGEVKLIPRLRREVAAKPKFQQMQQMLQVATASLSLEVRQMAAGRECLPPELGRMLWAEAISPDRLIKMFGNVQGLRVERDDFILLMENFVGKAESDRFGSMVWEAADMLVDHQMAWREARVLLLTLLLCTALSLQVSAMPELAPFCMTFLVSLSPIVVRNSC